MTIYDIAKLAGVSPSTVSRVINGNGYVKKETREKVQKILEEHNFVVSDNARSLVLKSTKMIGILVADFRSAHHAEGVYLIENELFKRGFSCSVFNTSNNIEAQIKYIYLLSKRNVEGAIFIGSIFQNEQLLLSIKKYLANIPIIIINGYMDLPNVYGVLTDDRAAVKNIVYDLSNKGRTRPAFVFDQNTVSTDQKMQGYLEGVKEYLVADPIIVKTKSEYANVYESTAELVRKHSDLDSIIYSIDLLAAIGLRALYSLNIDVPGDVFVYGMDNSIYSEIVRPQLSTIDTQIKDLSLMAARNMLLVLNGENVSKRTIIPSQFIKRESTL